MESLIQFYLNKKNSTSEADIRKALCSWIFAVAEIIYDPPVK